MIDFIYENETTGTFIEFSVDDIDESLPEDAIIDKFMERIKLFDDRKGIQLPKPLLALLSDDEMDLFLLAAYNDSYAKAIENMLYVAPKDSFVVDKNGIEYRVEFVEKRKTLISKETIGGVVYLSLSSKEMKDYRQFS